MPLFAFRQARRFALRKVLSVSGSSSLPLYNCFSVLDERWTWSNYIAPKEQENLSVRLLILFSRFVLHLDRPTSWFILITGWATRLEMFFSNRHVLEDLRKNYEKVSSKWKLCFRSANCSRKTSGGKVLCHRLPTSFCDDSIINNIAEAASRHFFAKTESNFTWTLSLSEHKNISTERAEKLEQIFIYPWSEKGKEYPLPEGKSIKTHSQEEMNGKTIDCCCLPPPACPQQSMRKINIKIISIYSAFFIFASFVIILTFVLWRLPFTSCWYSLHPSAIARAIVMVCNLWKCWTNSVWKIM